MGKTVLVTGAAGFIGSHVAEQLLGRGDRVVGLDNFDAFYDPAAKHRNVREVRAAHAAHTAFELVEGDVRDRGLLTSVLGRERFDAVVHLAALSGVRASIDQPALYFDVNVTGTIQLLDACVKHGSPNVVFASSSSVYGASDRLPFVEDDACDRPLAPYPASKRACELLGHGYHKLHGLDFTALRFFTVYGPRNRPDMMAGKLLASVTDGTPVPFYEGGALERDWTFVGDIAQGVCAAVDRRLGYEIVNLGRSEATLLAHFVRAVEERAGGKAVLVDEAKPAADARSTWASIEKARRLLGYAPQTSLERGIEALCRWRRSLSAETTSLTQQG